MNLVKLSFLFNAISVSVCGMLINFFEGYLPPSFSKIYRHGKFCANVKDAFLDKCEVPKRWFKHFYVVAGPFSTFALCLLIYRYVFNYKLPEIVARGVIYSLGAQTSALVPPENAILAITLFSVHCWKRFYESHYISIFSDVYMNFMLYIVGLAHYIGAIISITGESRQLLTDTKVVLKWTRLSYLEVSCSVVFLISTYMQYRSNVILANLRKDKKGNVVTKKHKVPKGELFDYVTAPLQLTEIMIYLSLCVILRSASTFYFVLLWVVTNQMECAYLSHEWSLRTFDDYPKSRKIIIPFVF